MNSFKTLTRDEADKIGKAAETADNVVIRAFVFVSLETGARPGELLCGALKWSDIRGQDVHIGETKEGRSRVIRLSSKTIEALDYTRGASDAVFAVSPGRLRRVWQNLCVGAIGRAVPLYALRDYALATVAIPVFQRGAEQ